MSKNLDKIINKVNIWYENRINEPILHTFISIEEQRQNYIVNLLLHDPNFIESFEYIYKNTDPMNKFTNRFKKSLK
jgi:hypothetical protein